MTHSVSTCNAVGTQAWRKERPFACLEQGLHSSTIGRGPARAHRDEEAVEHRLLHGLKAQTPIYMRGQEVKRAIFLAIRDSDTPAATKRRSA
jgi:hypothetical protein